MKRVTAGTYDRYIDAWDVCAILQAAGIDAKVVTKHAVQVHPDHVERAREVLAREQEKRNGGSDSTSGSESGASGSASDPEHRAKR